MLWFFVKRELFAWVKSDSISLSVEKYRDISKLSDICFWLKDLSSSFYDSRLFHGTVLTVKVYDSVVATCYKVSFFYERSRSIWPSKVSWKSRLTTPLGREVAQLDSKDALVKCFCSLEVCYWDIKPRYWVYVFHNIYVKKIIDLLIAYLL